MSSVLEKVIDLINTSDKNILVQASAGSGKTTLLFNLSETVLAGKNNLFLAYNKSIVNYFKTKTDSSKIKTIHSFGLSLLDRKEKSIIDDKKYIKLYLNYIKKDLFTEEHGEVLELFDLIRNLGVYTPKDLELMGHKLTAYDINERLFYGNLNAFSYLLEKGKEEYLLNHTVDFTDMNWLPTKLNMKMPQYDFIMVDECQDLNATQMTLLSKFKNARFIFVGDKHQAIYGFRGSDFNSLNNIQKIFNTENVYMDLTYRCPSKIIDIANEISPKIFSQKAGGNIFNIKERDILKYATKRDMFVARTNFPLMLLSYKLVSKGLNVDFLGKDLSISLINLSNKLKKTYSQSEIQSFPQLLVKYYKEHVLPEKEKDNQKFLYWYDNILCLKSFIERFKPANFSSLILKLKKYFEEPKNPDLILSTVHKSKGLEAKNIFMLHLELFPSPFVANKYQFDQEMNIFYVAITRALKNLYIVKPDKEMTYNTKLPDINKLAIIKFKLLSIAQERS